jgi:predicted acyl esterase
VTSIGGSALGLDGGTAKSLDSATLSYDPGTDTVLNIVSPRWNQSAASEIDIDFPITTDDFVVVGQPDLVLFVNETSTPAQEYSFTVLLEDIRPGQPTPWPVGSGRRYSHTNTGVPSKQEILMDTVKSRFKNGDTLRVVITNIALMTPVPTSIAPSGEVPMYAPAINKFTVAFQSALAGESATLTLPTIPASSLVLAPPAWQIMQH